MSGYLISPDPLSKATRINGAVFLFFDPPFSMSIALGTGQLRATRLAVQVRERQPEWSDRFWSLCAAHDRAMGAVEAYKRDLAPLDSLAGLHRMLHGPLDDATLDASSTIATSGDLTLDDVYRLSSQDVAAVDILAFLNIQAFDMCGQDSEARYRYCGDYLQRRPLRHLIAAAYVSRLRQQLGRPPEKLEVVLANDRARSLLLDLPLNPRVALSDSERRREAAWELFAEILRPYLEPLDQRRSRTIARLLSDRVAEVGRLRSKSYELAAQLTGSTSEAELSAELDPASVNLVGKMSAILPIRKVRARLTQ
jgi:hypothetical protein